MANSKTRICVTCGKEYEYCPRCKEDENKPTWMFAFHNEGCREIFNALTQFCSGKINADIAYDRIKDYVNEESISNFRPTVQEDLRKVFDLRTKVVDSTEEISIADDSLQKTRVRKSKTKVN